MLSSVPDATRNRLTVALRLIWVIPAYVVVYFVGIAASVVLFLAWFIVLFTGKWPEGMREFCIGYYRWSIRVDGLRRLAHRRVPALPPRSLSIPAGVDRWGASDQTSVSLGTTFSPSSATHAAGSGPGGITSTSVTPSLA